MRFFSIMIVMLLIAIGLSFFTSLNYLVIFGIMIMFAIGLSFSIPFAKQLYLKFFGKKVTATIVDWQITEMIPTQYETFYHLTMQYRFDYQG